MKNGVTFSYEISNNYILRDYLFNGNKRYDRRMPMRIKRDMPVYEHKYLSWENLTYCFVDRDSDEEDDYLLHHALQDEKKTSVIIWSRNVDDVLGAYDDRFNTYVEKKENGFYRIYVMRKGCLADYFDQDELEDYYDATGAWYNEGAYYFLMEQEMINLVNGKAFYIESAYSPLMDVEYGDSVTRDFGGAGGLVSGLLLGYPVESSLEFIKCPVLMH